MSAPVPAPSAKVLARIAALRFVGELTATDAAARDCRLITTEHGAQSAPDHIGLTLLLDAAGIVRDVRFRSPAQGAQLAAYDALAEQAVGRLLADAARLTPRQIDALLRDAGGGPVLDLVATNHPDADHPYYVLRKAAERAVSVEPETPPPGASTAAALPWSDIGLFEKVRRIEGVLDTHVRPALASDGGGLDLVDLKDDDLFVQYHGACGSCSSSIGGTLNFIQDSLNNHLQTHLAVRVTEAGGGESMVGL